MKVMKENSFEGDENHTPGVSHLLNTSSNKDQSGLLEENSKLRIELEKLYKDL